MEVQDFHRLAFFYFQLLGQVKIVTRNKKEDKIYISQEMF